MEEERRGRLYFDSEDEQQTELALELASQVPDAVPTGRTDFKLQAHSPFDTKTNNFVFMVSHVIDPRTNSFGSMGSHVTCPNDPQSV